jgi:hypothetical protein
MRTIPDDDPISYRRRQNEARTRKRLTVAIIGGGIILVAGLATVAVVAAKSRRDDTAGQQIVGKPVASSSALVSEIQSVSRSIIVFNDAGAFVTFALPAGTNPVNPDDVWMTVQAESLDNRTLKALPGDWRYVVVTVAPGKRLGPEEAENLIADAMRGESYQQWAGRNKKLLDSITRPHLPPTKRTP